MDILPRTKMHRHTSDPDNDNVIHDHLNRPNDMQMSLATHTHDLIENCGRAEWDFEKEFGEIIELNTAEWKEPSEIKYFLKGFLLYLILAGLLLVWWVGMWTIVFEWILER